MVSFVEAPYVMAVALVESTLYYKQNVTVDEICKCGFKAQQECNAQVLDAIIKSTRDDVYNAVTNYSDYFQLVDKDGVERITYATNKDMTDMINYFIGNIPFGILKVLRSVVHSVCKLPV